MSNRLNLLLLYCRELKLTSISMRFVYFGFDHKLTIVIDLQIMIISLLDLIAHQIIVK